MYTVEIIKSDGTIGKMFTLDLEGLNKLLVMATPFKVHFKVQKVLEEPSEENVNHLPDGRTIVQYE